MDVFEYVELAKNGTISVSEQVKKFTEEAERKNSEYNFFNLIDANSAMMQAKALEKVAKSGNAKGKL